MELRVKGSYLHLSDDYYYYMPPDLMARSTIDQSTFKATKVLASLAHRQSGTIVLADAMAAQLNSVRLKLEQRRRRIEEEKRKMEQVMERQREKVGQEAFLRAVIKGVLITLLIPRLTWLINSNFRSRPGGLFGHIGSRESPSDFKDGFQILN